jgi:predicted site-specific integrase-resolvase
MALLTVPEGARALAVDPRTLRAWIRAGKVPGLAVSVGERFFLRSSVLARLLNSGLAVHSALPVETVSEERQNDVDD